MNMLKFSTHLLFLDAVPSPSEHRNESEPARPLQDLHVGLCVGGVGGEVRQTWKQMVSIKLNKYCNSRIVVLKKGFAVMHIYEKQLRDIMKRSSPPLLNLQPTTPPTQRQQLQPALCILPGLFHDTQTLSASF